MTRLKLVALGILYSTALAAAGLTAPARVEPMDRDLARQPAPRYAADRLFSVNSSRSSIWVHSAVDGSYVERAVTLPGAFRVMVTNVAVAFDGRVAASVTATDREGRMVGALAFYARDGSQSKIVQTWPFGVSDLVFTGDGSLWALGILKDPSTLEEGPAHDILRQYDTDGKLVQSTIARTSLPKGTHPINGAQIASSRHYVAIVTRDHDWVTVSEKGVIVSQGRIKLPPGFQVFASAVTDTGRFFVAGSFEGDTPPPDGPRTALFEVATSGESQRVTTSNAIPDDEYGYLVGADGESLVFVLLREHQLLWSGLQ